MKRILTQLLSILFLTQLSACGGGGGDGGTTNPPPPPTNQAPVADAGNKQTVAESTTVSLTGSGTDSDGTIASYSWTQTSGTTVTLNNDSSATVDFDTPTTTEQLDLAFELTVTDDDGATATDTVAIEVMPVISGLVIDDLLINASVKLLTFPEQQLFAETTTNTEGRYSFQQSSLPEYLILQASGGTLNGVDFLGTLTAFCYTSERLSCHLTPISTLIKSYAERMGIIEAGEKDLWIEQVGISLELDLTTDPFVDENHSGTQLAAIRSYLQNGEQLESWLVSVLDFIEDGVISADINNWFSNVNQLPVVNAGNDQTVNEQTLVSLSGTASDIDGTIVSYLWTQVSGSAVTLTSNNSSSTSFTTPIVSADETLSFKLAVTDNENAVASDVVVIMVKKSADITPPVITLNGANSITLRAGDSYVELGATAIDNTDGAVSVTISGTVDTNTVGSYTVTYSATDSAKNSASRTRTVIVQSSPVTPDTTPPVITLNGASSITLTQGDSYVEPGATAIDDRDGAVTVDITGTVDTNTIGTYTLTYSATDTAKNASSLTRAVTVQLLSDTTAPVIFLNGSSTLTLTQGNTYIEQGAMAIDDRDGNVPVVISGIVDSSTVGSYTITYTATDTSNNISFKSRVINVVSQNAFITTWKTDNSGVTNNNQIKISTNGSGYDFHVDWGDGTTSSNVTGDIIHTYNLSGTYTVSISGIFPQIYFSDSDLDSQKLLSVEQWGDNPWRSMNRAFSNVALIINANDIPDLSQVTDMSFMFFQATKFNQDISSWDVSSVINMSYMFAHSRAFNQDLNSWDVSSVTNMEGMFLFATSFNQNLSNWNISSVVNLQKTFSAAYIFNQDISNWDVSSVNTMGLMFNGAKSFNQDISTWDVSLVTNMTGMFSRAAVFNQDLGNWDVSSVTDMSGMFGYAKLFDGDINSWDVSSVTDMSFIFNNAISFNQYIGSWDVSAVTDMTWMFESAVSFNQDVSNWDVSAVTDMKGMFRFATTFNQVVGSWDVSAVTNMSRMFNVALSFNQDLSGWDVSSVSDMSGMLMGPVHFNYDISSWDVSAVTNMGWMFAESRAFNQNISSWDVSSVSNMNSMFYNANSFNQDLSNWDVSAVTDMSSMFYDALTFDQNLGNWDISSVTSLSSMFINVTISTANYDALLLGWSAQSVKANVVFHGGNSQYSASSQVARDTLTGTPNNWNITDGGVVP